METIVIVSPSTSGWIVRFLGPTASGFRVLFGTDTLDLNLHLAVPLIVWIQRMQKARKTPELEFSLPGLSELPPDKHARLKELGDQLAVWHARLDMLAGRKPPV